MKRKVLAAILCLALSFGFAGCGEKTKTVTEEVEKTYGAYSQVWTASDEAVTHETGDLAIDDGWGAVLDTEHGNLCSAKTATLRAPAYTAAARLLVNEKSSSKNVAAVLRVLDKNGKELGRQNIRICDFNASLTYQDFTFTFPVEEPTEATFDIYWPGTDYVRVSEFGIMSKNANSLPDFNSTGESLLGVNIEEDSEITYSESNLYFFDLYDYMVTVAADVQEQYDIANLISTLQGLVNRDGQRLYIRFTYGTETQTTPDEYWLEYLTKEGQFLGEKEVVTVKSPMTLLKLFDSYYTGFAAWDMEVPATVNAVATACGVDNLLPVRYSSVRNSLYYYVTHNAAFSNKPMKVDLGGKFTGEGTVYGTQTQSTGSRKNDAYIWAKETYLDTHKVNSHLMAYHVDAYASDTVFAAYGDLQNRFLANRDYYIANKSFFFDVSPWEFNIPNDDPDQIKMEEDGDMDVGVEGTKDYATLVAVMTAQAKYAESVDATKPIDVGGFTPWHIKYTRHTDPTAPGDVQTEWETVYQFSIYNAYINADAPGLTSMANASIFSQYPMKDTYKQKASKEIKETLPTAQEQGANYIMFYVGDFDASAWLNTAMIKLWNDPKRGEIPLCWSFALDIHKRAGHVIDWMYETATENDYFVAGDNGVGYLDPESFDDPSGRSDDIYGDLDSWAAYNKTVFERFDIDYAGFLITKKSAPQKIIECYAKFSKGVATNFPYEEAKVQGIEVTRSEDYTSVANLVASKSKKNVGDSSTFSQLRFILRSPTDIYAVYTALMSDEYKDYNFKIVDPYTFYGLLAQQNAQ